MQAFPSRDQWTPAVDSQYAYAYVGSYSPGLYVINKQTGVLAFTIADPDFNWNGWSMNEAPALGGMHDAFGINNNRLIRFNLQNQTIDWQISGSFTGQPAIANGVVYVINGGVLNARDQVSGALLWSVASPVGLQGPFIVTNSHVFVASASATYAIDLQTHQSVWSYAKSGLLTLGNEALYIASSDGYLTAINVPMDNDHDGLLDKLDNCPFVANADQIDTDADGHGDLCDAFPNNPAEWLDSDGDGTGDNADNCVNASNPDQLDVDSDGRGDVCDAFPNNLAEWKDTDSDGVGEQWRQLSLGYQCRPAGC